MTEIKQVEFKDLPTALHYYTVTGRTDVAIELYKARFSAKPEICYVWRDSHEKAYNCMPLAGQDVPQDAPQEPQEAF